MTRAILIGFATAALVAGLACASGKATPDTDDGRALASPTPIVQDTKVPIYSGEFDTPTPDPAMATTTTPPDPSAFSEENCRRPTPPPTNEMTRYVDPLSGLAFRYPANWHLRDLGLEEEGTRHSVDVSSWDVLTACPLGWIQPDQFALGVSITRNTTGLTLGGLATMYRSTNPLVTGLEDTATTVDGFDAQQISFVNLQGVMVIHTVVATPDWQIVITGNPGDSPLRGTYESVLSSLEMPDG